MRIAGVVLLGLLPLSLSACSKSTTTGGGDGGGNASKILGTWTCVEGSAKGLAVEFLKDGKFTTLSEQGKPGFGAPTNSTGTS